LRSIATPSPTLTARELTDSDHTRWNDFVGALPAVDVLQAWEWGAVKAEWTPARVAVLRGDAIVAGAAILKRSLPMVGAAMNRLSDCDWSIHFWRRANPDFADGLHHAREKRADHYRHACEQHADAALREIRELIEWFIGDVVDELGSRQEVEEFFEDCKGYLGMAQYETRSWTGWHHHMTLVALAHLFVTLTRLGLKKKCRS